MLRRSDLFLKGVCYLAGAILLYQVGHLVLRPDPLKKVKIPQLPTLTNAPSTDGPGLAASARTNAATNAASVTSRTNAGSTNLAATLKAAASTNQSASTNPTAPVASLTNVESGNLAESARPPVASTNVSSSRPPESGTAVARAAAGKNPRLSAVKSAASGVVRGSTAFSNLVATAGNNALSGATNALGGSSTNATNLTAKGAPASSSGGPRGAMAMGMPGGMPGGMRGPMPPLPKEVQARLDRITDSEILAPVMRPLPMALLGIAGDQIFLRGPNGQTGLVKMGDSLGSVKVLKIGINRVLVEEDGEKKELTIFAGMGGEPLLSTEKKNR